MRWFCFFEVIMVPKPKKKSKNKKKKHTKRGKRIESKKQREERERRRKERERQRMLRDLGREICEVSEDILEGQTDIKPGWSWGTPFVMIGPCDGSCISPMHKQFLVSMFEDELSFHCDLEELVAFSQTEETKFVQLGEFALIQDEKETNAVLGWDIRQISEEILSTPSILNAFRTEDRIYGSPVVTISTCDGSCDSPLHKYFLILLYDGQFAFHCDLEELVAFSETEAIEDFIALGEHAITEAIKEKLVAAQQENGIQIDVVEPEEVDEYLAEHPELLDHPAGRAQAIAKVGMMKSKRIEEADEAEDVEETEES